MTKKHFEKFAKSIKQHIDYALCYPEKAEEHIRCAKSEFYMVCEVAEQFNANFDREVFKKACGLEGMN